MQGTITAAGQLPPLFLFPALRTRIHCPQVFPTINPGSVPVLPERGDAIRADRGNGDYAGGGGVGQPRVENRWVARIAHCVMPAAAFCAQLHSPAPAFGAGVPQVQVRAACPHQGGCVQAAMAVITDDGQFFFLAIGSNGGGFQDCLYGKSW
jgi:hypothetical protein